MIAHSIGLTVWPLSESLHTFASAPALIVNNGATLDDLREAVTTFEDTGRIARRVLGGAHPLTVNIEGCLRKVRALSARETGGAREPVSTTN